MNGGMKNAGKSLKKKMVAIEDLNKLEYIH